MASHVGQAKPDKIHASHKGGQQPKAKSAGGEPSEEPTPVHHAPKVGPEDEPKGHPNSDRFHSEQAASHAKGKP